MIIIIIIIRSRHSRRRRVILSYKESKFKKKNKLKKQTKIVNLMKKFVARAQKNNVIFAIDNDFWVSVSRFWIYLYISCRLNINKRKKNNKKGSSKFDGNDWDIVEIMFLKLWLINVQSKINWQYINLLFSVLTNESYYLVFLFKLKAFIYYTNDILSEIRTEKINFLFIK